MSILEALAALGFTNATDLSSTDCRRDEGTLVRIMTKDGWTYQRFANADEVTAWAMDRVPS